MGAMESLLRAVMAEEDPARLEGAIAAAREGVGADGPALDEADARTLRALQQRLAQGARREELLRTVSSIAVDVTTRRDVVGVLHEIVRRTRLLTGADMAYIALNTADTTFIRESDGVRTEEYRTLRMPIGYGVLGRAATGRAIVTTADYLEDAALSHIGEIDDIVRGEGVRSILAVPMTLREQVHGALLIADRTSREYPPETVDIVDTLSRHASVALDNARRFEEVTGALASLSAQQDEDEERMVELHEILDLDAGLLEALLDGGDLEVLARRVHELLGADLALLDAGGVPMVETDPGARLAVGLDGEALRAARGTGRPAVSGGTTLACASSGREHLGTLVVGRALAPRLLPRVQRVAVFFGILLLLGRAQQDDRRRRDRAVIDALVRGGREVDTVRGDARVRAVRPGAGVRMVAIDVFDLDVGPLADRLRAGTAHDGAVVALHGDHLCVLVPDAAADALSALLDVAGSGVNAGWSSPVEDLERIPAAHRSAELALRSLAVLGVRGRSADGERIGMVGLMAEAIHRDPTLPSPLLVIRPLEDYDREHGTELTRSAWAFAESGRHVPRTAQMLHVHPNTVRQRLERIAGLLGEDWRAPARFLDLHFALRMWSLGREEAGG
ncbi:helix-turn-helix domain-containing protein [Brachybacterium sp. ACRRE]|uniref:helix-turn-helix domain-containing protein n=1 Tax=Brachybacterium sp. ACRRE TaxID=2918184 RepID=UPI001EF1FDCE|nr:helix-turn-helix domain-containing protein [Brachybacterium sp. ACRRE]MCG7310659.1 helix-turn-helix domain-containing protein [Brachybacterium sp. ACRRE]